MKVTGNDIVDKARTQVGYHEQGGSHNDGNVTKYWAELAPGLQGQPWCAGFVSWVFKRAGFPLPAIGQPWGFAYCPSAVTYARNHGELVPRSDARAGDIGFANFTGGDLAEHTFIVAGNDGSSLHTIEGNTSPVTYGSQANGGGVYAKVRPYSDVVAVWRVIDRPKHPKPNHHPRHNPFASPTRNLTEGASGEGVRFVQWSAGCPVDGKFGPHTLHAVREFQRYHGLAVDGVVGPVTRAALAHVNH